jgi:hypothetical protein
MWWEAVWAARTVLLTLISVFSFPMQRYYSVLSLLGQCSAADHIFWASAALQIIFKPYMPCQCCTACTWCQPLAWQPPPWGH